LNATYVGYTEQNLNISAAYLKFFMAPIGVDISTLRINDVEGQNGTYRWDASGSGSNYYSSPSYSVQNSVNEVAVSMEVLKPQLFKKQSFRKGRNAPSDAYSDFDKKAGTKDRERYKLETRSQEQTINTSKPVAIVQAKKDLRVEYTIASKMTIPTDGMDHRVSISTYDLNASYEYHVIPKMDASVYLAAQVTGWEKLNLMSGESNIYFDGTFMGKSFLDVNSTKDTLSFSFGKDNKISVDRTRIKEKSKFNTIGKRQKFEVSWEIKIKNNGGAMIPLIVKDQFPISNNEDIKVKHGTFNTGKLEKNTSIITWSFLNGVSGIQTLNFNYSVDYRNGMTLYIE
jgi:uncharacterized protein (TIGR02231 family)